MIKSQQVLLQGWMGEENCGDELILEGLLKMIEQIDNSIRINVMGTKPDNIRNDHDSINRSSTYIDGTLKSILRAILKYNIIDVIINIVQSKYLIISSGGALSDWNPESTKTMFFLIKVFKKIFKRPVMLIGIGAGPILHEKSSNRFYNILKQVDFITVRDNESYELLKSIGLKNISLANDCVFDLFKQNSNNINLAKETESKKIGIILAPLFNKNSIKYKTYLQSVIKYIELLKKDEWDITPILFHYENDKEFYQSIYEATDIEFNNYNKFNLWELIDIMHKQDIIVGMRYHSVVLSLIIGIPVIPIIYHNKVYSVAKEFELLDVCEEIGNGSNWKNADIDYLRLFQNTKFIYENNCKQKEKMQVNMVKKNMNNTNFELLSKFLKV